MYFRPQLMDIQTAHGEQHIGLYELCCSMIADVFFVIFVGSCVLLIGCSPSLVWKAEAPSPGGHYIAIAETVQTGGFGTASISTSVSLKQNIQSIPAMQVLAFDCLGPVPRPYVLDNVANAGGAIDLKMKWLAPEHLQVSYNGREGTVNFQAVRYQSINISLVDVSPGKAANPSP